MQSAQKAFPGIVYLNYAGYNRLQLNRKHKALLPNQRMPQSITINRNTTLTMHYETVSNGRVITKHNETVTNSTPLSQTISFNNKYLPETRRITFIKIHNIFPEHFFADFDSKNNAIWIWIIAIIVLLFLIWLFLQNKQKNNVSNFNFRI